MRAGCGGATSVSEVTGDVPGDVDGILCSYSRIGCAGNSYTVLFHRGCRCVTTALAEIVRHVSIRLTCSLQLQQHIWRTPSGKDNSRHERERHPRKHDLPMSMSWPSEHGSITGSLGLPWRNITRYIQAPFPRLSEAASGNTWQCPQMFGAVEMPVHPTQRIGSRRIRCGRSGSEVVRGRVVRDLPRSTESFIPPFAALRSI